MSSDRRIIIALLLCLGIISIGTSGYIIIEDYTLLEAFYMSVITLATVGFSEVKPLSAVGRGFTTILIIVGFICLAFVGRAVVESLLETVWSGKSGLKKMKKRISQLKEHYIICGFGRVGASSAEYFKKNGVGFTIIENDPEHCLEISKKEYLYIKGDATRENTLLESGIKSAKGLLALLNSDPDNLFIVLSARELNPTLHIIARADDASSEKKIFRAGADSVISPFATAGKQIAGDILTATGKEISATGIQDLPVVTPKWLTISDSFDMSGETVGTAADKMDCRIIGVRRKGRDFLLPSHDELLQMSDMLFVIEDEKHNGRFSAHQPHKIVIVDDNQVILRLYTRLFQKAGFHPITETNGHDGLNTIIREKPAAAVIDFMLPFLSGIEVCRQVRRINSCKATKLILFTADNQPKTRKQALEAGADEVVIKSPDASEVIETVIRIIEKENCSLPGSGDTSP